MVHQSAVQALNAAKELMLQLMRNHEYNRNVVGKTVKTPSGELWTFTDTPAGGQWKREENPDLKRKSEENGDEDEMEVDVEVKKETKVKLEEPDEH